MPYEEHAAARQELEMRYTNRIVFWNASSHIDYWIGSKLALSLVGGCHCRKAERHSFQTGSRCEIISSYGLQLPYVNSTLYKLDII